MSLHAVCIFSQSSAFCLYMFICSRCCVVKVSLLQNCILSLKLLWSRAYCMPCLLGVLTYLVHSLAELMPSLSVLTDVGWLASSLLLMISFTVLALGCLRKCVTQPTASITSCHPSNLQIMPCEVRNSGQSYILPHCNYQFHKNSFINWCLFS